MDSSRRRIFLATVSLLFLLLFIYVGHQLVRFTTFSTTETVLVLVIVLISILLTISLPFFFWDQDRALIDPALVVISPVLSWLQFLAYFGLVYFNFVFFLVVGRDIIGFVDYYLLKIEFFSYSSLETIIILLTGSALVVLGAIPVLLGPKVVKVKLKSNKIKGDKTFRIVQASDIHIGELWSNTRVAMIRDKIEKLNPDLVVLTGDIIDGNVTQYKKAIDLLSEIKSKYGIFYVPGNHEYYWNWPANYKALEQTKIKVLLNKGMLINWEENVIGVSGVADSAAKYFDLEKPNFKKAFNDIESADYKIVLVHQPFLADTAKEHMFDLQLSGHTHAGQFAPWNFLIGLFQKYSKGLYKLKRADGGELKLYVNQGTGFWGPPNRFGTICELTEITIE